MNPLLLIAIALSFVVTLFLASRWIPVARKTGLVGKDMNKPAQPEVAEMGGVAVMGGVLGGLLFYIALNTFVLDQVDFNLTLFATMSTILIITFVGIIDDFLGWKMGLSQLQKPLLTIPAALPMMVINAGHSSIALPLVGDVNLGILYPLLLVPIGIVGASNGFNILAGFNGLEAGMGAVILGAISLVAYLTGSSYVAMVGAIGVAALLAFLMFNWYPAKIFPGNALTYMVGALIGCVTILANVEKLALVLFIPYFLDFVLKARSRMKAETFAKVSSDGSMSKPYEKIYSITHLSVVVLSRVKRKVYERDVVILLIAVEAVLAVIGIKLYI
jgi:UDP-N-acetylglucosamine--dolichyl-phosphate N-acetylglucosaminephosphotransferase